MDKSADAFRTISEVADELDLPQHVLRFWETRFTQIKPLKRAGGRRFYRPRDIEILRAIKYFLYGEGYTIKGVQRILKEHGASAVTAASHALREGSSDFASSAQDLPPLPSETAWPSEQTGQAAGAPCCGAPFSPAPKAPAAPSGRLDTDLDADNAAGVASEGRAWSIALLADDVAKLQAVLTELEECERILESVRRR